MIVLMLDCLFSWMSGWFTTAFEVVIMFGGAVKLERETLHCLCEPWKYGLENLRLCS